MPLSWLVQPAWILTFILTLVASFKVIATPPEQFNYMVNCQGCHLPDGRGFPARNVPDLRNNLGKFLLVDGGREFIVQVPGSAQSDLNDQSLARLLNWMLETISPKQIPADFKPYSKQEVAQLRQKPLVYVTEVRNKLILKIQEYEKNN